MHETLDPAQALEYNCLTMTTATLTAPEFHATYGSCPACGAKGASRERSLRGGRDTCANGHMYLSSAAVYPVAK